MAVKAQSPNHWTAREFPEMGVFQVDQIGLLIAKASVKLWNLPKMVRNVWSSGERRGNSEKSHFTPNTVPETPDETVWRWEPACRTHIKEVSIASR